MGTTCSASDGHCCSSAGGKGIRPPCGGPTDPSSEEVVAGPDFHKGHLGEKWAEKGAGKIGELQMRYDQLMDARAAHSFPEGWVPTHTLASMIKSLPNIAPMRVIPLGSVEKAAEDGTVSSLNYTDSTVHVGDLPAGSRVLLISHRWWSSRGAEPDQVKAGWPKLRAILANVIPHFIEKMCCRREEIYLWWDFVSIYQEDGDLKWSQIECIPVFVAMSDAVIACRSGDEDFHAEGGARVWDKTSQALVPFEKPIHSHPGHYNNRVWTMCELFMATSDFQMSFRGEQMPVFSVEFDASYNIVAGPEDQTKILRSQFHEIHSWSMPPRENLISQDDLTMLEPLIVMLADSEMPRIVRAAKFGLPRALAALMAAGEDVNERDPYSKEAALHDIARSQDEDVLKRLLGDPGIQVNVRNKAGQTPLHLLVSSGMFDHRHEPEKQKRCVQLLLEAGADPSLKDYRTRTAVDCAVSRYGAGWASELFPGVERQARPEMTVRHSRLAQDMPQEHRRKFDSGNVIRWRAIQGKREASTNKSPIVCFATGLASSLMYLEWAERVAEETSCEVILVDPPGNGHSEFRRNGVKTPLDLEKQLEGLSTTESMMELYCQDLMVVIKEQGWGERGMHLVGTSFGGIIAAYLAIAKPLWAKDLALYGWLHSTRHSTEVKANLRGMVEGLVGLFTQEKTEEFEKALEGFLSPTTPKELKELFFEACRPGGDVYEGSGGMNMLSLLMYALLKNVLPLESLPVPLLVVQGEADAMFMDHAIQLKRLVPHCRLSIVPHVCHIPPVENPVDSSSIYLDFLQTNGSLNVEKVSQQAPSDPNLSVTRRRSSRALTSSKIV